METIHKLTNLANERDYYIKKYQDNLANWSRLPEEDIALNASLEEIEVIINE